MRDVAVGLFISAIIVVGTVFGVYYLGPSHTHAKYCHELIGARYSSSDPIADTIYDASYNPVTDSCTIYVPTNSVQGTYELIWRNGWVNGGS